MKIAIVGDAYVLTTDITTEQIQLLEKANPAALKVIDKESKAQKFAISYRGGGSSVT